MRPYPFRLFAAAVLMHLTQAAAQPRTAHPARSAGHAVPAAPRAIGKFEDWTAATHQEAGQTVCYAFTRAASSTPPLPGRGDVVLTVTQRPGGARDAVAISAGFAYAANAEVTLQVEATTLAVLHQPALRLRAGRPRHRRRVRARAAGGRQVRRAAQHRRGRHLQPARLLARLRRHQQGLLRQRRAEHVRRPADRRRARPHPRQVGAVLPAAGRPAGRAARAGGADARRAGRRSWPRSARSRSAPSSCGIGSTTRAPPTSPPCPPSRARCSASWPSGS